MIHRLRVGHFDREALRNSEFVVVKPIDRDDLDAVVADCNGDYDGESIVVNGQSILMKDGYLDCPWKTPQLNLEVVEFIQKLHARIQCVVFERLIAGELKVDELAITP